MPDLPLTVIRHAQNLGYGGNQKAGYRWAIEHDLDIVVLLHGDGQYAPEFLPEMVAPLERDECDAVFGSRMMEPGAARRGGMPLYKYVGNRILTTRSRTRWWAPSLSEWHSGYRAYSVDALRDIPFERNPTASTSTPRSSCSCTRPGSGIVEIPIPTYYGDEICYVNGMQYAQDVVVDVVRYRAAQDGLRARRAGVRQRGVRAQGRRRQLARPHPRAGSRSGRPCRVLDLGCSDGALGASAAPARATTSPASTARARRRRATGSTRFVEADLEPGHPRRGRTAATTSCSPPTCSSTSASPSALLGRRARRARARGHGHGERAELRATGTRGCGWRSAGSTTTGAASSTGATCASSPGAASSGSSPPRASHVRRREAVGPAARGRRPGRGRRRGALAPAVGAPAALDRVGVARAPDAVRLPVRLRARAGRSNGRRTRSHSGVGTGSSRTVPENGAWPAALPIVA